MRFVIADDSSIPRDYLRGIILRAGHEVVAAAKDGREAVDACRLHRPDVVVLDNSMPVLTGLEAADRIASERTAAYIFMASADTQDAIVRIALARGYHFVGKPYEDAQLLAALDAAIPNLHE